MIAFNAVQDLFSPNQQAISKGQDRYFCPDCRRTLEKKMFFKTTRIEKFPAGILPKCKKCLSLTIDDSDITTFLSILKEINIPYVPKAWRDMLVQKEPGSPSIIGKYVSKMNLNQFKKYRWADSEKLMEDEEKAILEALTYSGKTQTEAEKELESYLDLKAAAPEVEMGAMISGSVNPQAGGKNIAALYGLTPETSKYGLTQEEINNYQFIWGTDYSEDEYYRMEKLYSEMYQSYPQLSMNDPMAVNNARTICKMTVKMNKFLDLDDVESASKISRQLDLFIKSSNLAPQQQKDRNQSTFSISQLAFYIEKNKGFIPSFYVERPQDKIDGILLEMQKYTERLIKGEPEIETLLKGQEQVLQKYSLPEEDMSPEDIFDELERDVMRELEESIEVIEDGEADAVSD